MGGKNDREKKWKKRKSEKKNSKLINYFYIFLIIHLTCFLH